MARMRGQIRKQREYDLCEEWYTKQGLNAKECSIKLISLGMQATEKTVGDWVERGNWRAIRNANQNTPEKRIETILQTIDLDTERKLELAKMAHETTRSINTCSKEEQADLIEQKKSILKEISSIDDGISKWNKLLENIDRENKITLNTYLIVMKRIFSAMQRDHIALHSQTLDFQEEHLRDIAQELG